jgi:hypothetical protein
LKTKLYLSSAAVIDKEITIQQLFLRFVVPMRTKGKHMKKIIVSSIAAATLALSMGAHASAFNYIDYAMGTVEYDGGGDADYSNLSAVFETPIVPLISLESIDLGGADILKLGIGTSIELGGYTHLYGFVHYNDYDDNGDNDFSLTAGIRSTLTDRLELRASYSTYTDRDSLDGYKIGLGYYLTKNFSLSGNYEALEFADIVSFSARLHF